MVSAEIIFYLFYDLTPLLRAIVMQEWMVGQTQWVPYDLPNLYER